MTRDINFDSINKIAFFLPLITLDGSTSHAWNFFFPTKPRTQACFTYRKAQYVIFQLMRIKNKM